MFDQYVSPWVTMVDDARFQQTVDRVEALHPRALAGCHTLAVGEAFVTRAMAATRRTPTAVVPPEPGQAVLDEIQRAMHVVAA
jgi:hypothetical protein